MHKFKYACIFFYTSLGKWSKLLLYFSIMKRNKLEILSIKKCMCIFVSENQLMTSTWKLPFQCYLIYLHWWQCIQNFFKKHLQQFKSKHCVSACYCSYQSDHQAIILHSMETSVFFTLAGKFHGNNFKMSFHMHVTSHRIAESDVSSLNWLQRAGPSHFCLIWCLLHIVCLMYLPLWCFLPCQWLWYFLTGRHHN